ncbi:MAG: glutamate--tRNA ligase, partial [Cyclobacteriaceae bacterium]
PAHVLLYQFLEWEDRMPQFAHLPLILNPNGEGKLSKRHADKYGFPVFPLNWEFTNDKGEKAISKGFKESDYLPEALTNFLSFLGWNPGTQEEIFSLEGLCKAFSIERVGKAGTKFDIEKLNWFNEHYLRKKTGEELAVFLADQLDEKGITYDAATLPTVCEMMKERVTFIHQLYSEAGYFFESPKQYDEKVVQKKWNQEVVDGIGAFAQALPTLEDFTADAIKQHLYDTLEAKGIKMGKVMQPLRVAITGVAGGPDLMPLIEFLGKDIVIERLEKAIETISVVN